MLLRLIAFYQRWVSPVLPPHCRFVPSCSSYAAQAIECHGAGRGSALALKRLCRCHPFHPGGYDPVPYPSAPANPASIRKASESGEILPPNRH